MPVRFGRIVLTAIAVEALAIVTLVLLVVAFGPSDPDAARAYAGRLGYWVGPIAGFFLCIGGGWFVTRGHASRHAATGLALGACVAAIDVAILVAGGAGFETIFVVSNAGKLAAGTLGGWFAGRRHGGASPLVPSR